jgi:hypothetical protein
MKATVESNAYQDKITTFWDKLNHKWVKAEVLPAAAATISTVLGQQPHVQLASIPDLEQFDDSCDRLHSFVSYSCMNLARDTSYILNPQH